jgi:hypothetical protein
MSDQQGQLARSRTVPRYFVAHLDAEHFKHLNRDEFCVVIVTPRYAGLQHCKGVLCRI